ncbi:MAG: type II toxin-antitoxin system Phd/YefM family antitoxin [Nitrospirota bacterium]
MKFVKVRDIRINSNKVWEELGGTSEMIITSKGKPIGILSGVNEDNFENIVKSIRQSRATLALAEIHKEAIKNRTAYTISDENIEAEIKQVRRNRPK